MRFGVLGALTVWTTGGEVVSVPGAKVRGLLSDLLVHEGRPVPADRLVDDLWREDELPGNPAAALSVKVSQLRRILEDAEPGSRGLVAGVPAGYMITASTDAAAFEELLAGAAAAADPKTRAGLLAEALALWRGPAFADFADHDFTRAASARLHELRLTAEEDRAEARLELGEHAALAAELADLLGEHPLRERLRAAHMRALYRSGRQGEALAGYERHRAVLAEELGLDPGPELAALHQAVLVQDPALAPASAVTGNVPVPIGALIGREEAVEEILAHAGRERLVTLTGPGGVGKTRLVVEVAGRLSAPDGVWLVELAAADRAGDADAVARLAEAVTVVLGLRGGGDPVERLAEALRPRRTVIVLDNCEHVIEPVAALAGRLLAVAPGLRLLATSQESLGLAGELVWSVPPLEVPGGGEPVGRAAAVRLFVERARAADRGFRLEEDNAQAVAVLCRRLDGIPLALELAATRVRALGVAGVVERLDDRFRLLAAGLRGAPPRQQTLLAMIDWSWGLLDDEEKAALRRLAVHADGCTPEAAEAVGGGGPDVLARLVDRSLVAVHEGRYRLLESVAAYCVRRLREAGELEDLRERHHRYYAGLAARARPYLRGDEQRGWLLRLDAEAANLRAALGHAVRAGAAGDALALAGSLGWYWFLRGRLSEGVRALRSALSVDGGAAHLRAAAMAWQTGLEFLSGDVLHTPEPGAPDATALALALAGGAEPGVGEAVGRASRRAAALAGFGPPAGDALEAAAARWFLAYASIDLGDMSAAGDLLGAALPAFEAGRDAWGVAATLAVWAKLAHVRGDLEAVERDARRSRAAFAALGDRWGQMEAVGWLGGAAELRGDLETADRLQREGLGMAEELELWTEVAGRLAWVGWLAHQRGEHAAAVTDCERALAMARRQAHHASQILAMMGLAFSARQCGDLDRADRLLGEIRSLSALGEGPEGERPAVTEEPPPYLPLVLAQQAFVAEGRGEPERALRLSLAALDTAAALRYELGFPPGLMALAAALAGVGRPELAAAALAVLEELTETTPLSASERADRDRVAARLRADLGDQACAAPLTREELINAARSLPH
ncbi:BTAD domain-containing putative transcriptional regulator [Nonomuraea typhae]|uniref:BTAD domain-containing putative transcriptional regulator n=1 Tax=Nonomuraea typhae TaxID=2603600 RepID=UPI0012F9AD8D|nr:BTAD domain-containing putative transcriptional regulator [Nonomuraea typhae]